MENNPEALEDVKQTVAMDQYGNPITKQPLAGGGTVVERDVEAQTSGPATVTVTTQPSTARQTVNPTVTTTTSKQAQTQTTSSGWWDVFASRSQGRYFFPLHAAIVFFSFLVLVSASIIETTFVAGAAAGTTGTLFVQYAIVIAQFAFAVSLGACVMDRLGLLSNAYLRVALSVFQLFFWIPGLVLLTFFGSFLSPVTNANGFFGAWFALLAAAAIFSHESQRANPERRNFTSPVTALLLLFFIGLMEMGSAIQLYAGNYQNLPNNGFTAQNGPPFNYTVFGISWGAITAFLALVLLLFYEAFSPVLTLALSIFVWLWVVVGALVLTFADPWRLALGNGYYSCLFAVVASMGLLISLRKADQNPGQNTTTYRNTTGNANANATTTTTNVNRRDDNYYSTSFYSFVRGGAIASLGVLVAACLTCRNHGGCNGNIERYQIAAGAVGLGLGLIFIILELVGFGHVPSIVKIIFSFIWMAWWIAAFIILTWFGSFQGPVNNTEYANGFFFTWIALVFACLAFAAAIKEQSTVSETQNLLVPKLGFLFVIVIGSLIELGSAINAYYVVGNNNLTRYALALGCVSIFLILVLLVTLTCLRTNNTAHDSTYHFVLYILLIWWAVGALVLTYKPLWTAATDNGYFSLFFTLTTVLLALSGIWRHEDEANYYDTQQQTTTTTTNNNYQAFGNEPNTTTYAAATTSGPAGGEATATTSSAKY